MTNEEAFLKFSGEKLAQLFGRIETCVGKLTPEQIWRRAADNDNAVGNLVLHLAGNVRQWILCGVGGQEDRRDRDSEFAARSGDDVVSRLRPVVSEAVALIAALPPDRLTETRTIQKHYNVTVLEAIYHVVEHFSMHTGQIIFATKLLTGEDLEFYGYLKSGSAKMEETP
jgi:uncharacterized damage-inducible protein DinB